jgi:hypothetical protein
MPLAFLGRRLETVVFGDVSGFVFYWGVGVVFFNFIIIKFSVADFLQLLNITKNPGLCMTENKAFLCIYYKFQQLTNP